MRSPPALRLHRILRYRRNSCYKYALSPFLFSDDGNPENRAYSNFDTASDFYKYEVDTPEKAKEKAALVSARRTADVYCVDTDFNQVLLISHKRRFKRRYNG